MCLLSRYTIDYYFFHGFYKEVSVGFVIDGFSVFAVECIYRYCYFCLVHAEVEDECSYACGFESSSLEALEAPGSWVVPSCVCSAFDFLFAFAFAEFYSFEL